MDTFTNFLADHPWLTCALLVTLIYVSSFFDGVLP